MQLLDVIDVNMSTNTNGRPAQKCRQSMLTRLTSRKVQSVDSRPLCQILDLVSLVRLAGWLAVRYKLVGIYYMTATWPLLLSSVVFLKSHKLTLEVNQQKSAARRHHPLDKCSFFYWSKHAALFFVDAFLCFS